MTGGVRTRASRGLVPAASRGVSLTDLLVAVGLSALLAAVAVPLLVEASAVADASAAVRFVAAQCGLARATASRRGRSVALRFLRTPTGWQTVLVSDGNGNGVRSSEVAAGVDPTLRAAQPLDGRFGEAALRIVVSVPAIESTGTLASGDDPVRLGALDQLVFTPSGSSSGGTLYVAGRRGHQFAVRVLGATGRIRVLRFVPSLRSWEPV